MQTAEDDRMKCARYDGKGMVAPFLEEVHTRSDNQPPSTAITDRVEDFLLLLWRQRRVKRLDLDRADLN